MCIFRLLGALHANEHPSKVHLYGFSPVCVIICVVSARFVRAAYSQPSNMHLYGFSPVWIIMCFFSAF